MNLNIKIIFVLLITIIPLAAQDVYEIKLNISKSIYLVGEPVAIGISLINTSTMIIQDETLGYTELKIIDNYGQHVKRGGMSGAFWGPYKNKLVPNEEDYYVYELNDYFGEDFPGLMASKQFFTGNYTIKVEFFPKNQRYNQVSAQISFQVVEPQGEEKVVYDRFIEILKQEWPNKLTRENELRTANDFRVLYESNPNSVYSSFILINLIAVYGTGLGDGENAIWASKELVEKHSSSVNAIYQLNWLVDQMKSESEKIEYVNSIKAKSEGTLMEKMYEQRIKEIEKK